RLRPVPAAYPSPSSGAPAVRRLSPSTMPGSRFLLAVSLLLPTDTVTESLRAETTFCHTVARLHRRRAVTWLLRELRATERACPRDRPPQHGEQPTLIVSRSRGRRRRS